MNFVFTKSKEILTFTILHFLISSKDHFFVDSYPTLGLTYQYLCLAMPGVAFAALLLLLLRKVQKTCFRGWNI